MPEVDTIDTTPLCQLAESAKHEALRDRIAGLLLENRRHFREYERTVANAGVAKDTTSAAWWYRQARRAIVEIQRNMDKVVKMGNGK